MTIRDREALEERARNLGTLNGMQLVRVTLESAPSPVQAVLEVHFHNDQHLAGLAAAVQADPDTAPFVFPITGGHRLPAGPLAEQVRVVAVAADPADARVLRLTVLPIGDYSTYTLGVVAAGIDPVFAEIPFRFRPGCFENCPPDWERPRPAAPGPVIDYLARDYHSFRHLLITRMMELVPDWQPTSEADLDMVLLELFSAAADELSDFQDRVMNEAYLGSARKRVSLARHARLMDYHIHQGNQASTWLALEVDGPGELLLAPAFVAASAPTTEARAVVFLTREQRRLHPLLNDLALHTWSDAFPALAEGTVRAELAVPDEAAADLVVDLVRGGDVDHLLIEERLNPLTGRPAGRDPGKRQLLRLLEGAAGASKVRDPVEGAWAVRVRWRDEDRLRRRYCFVIDCSGTRVAGVSSFRGNLVPAFHGRPEAVVFRDPATPLPAFPVPGAPAELHFERAWGEEAVCRLPSPFLAYRNTPPGGLVPARSTLAVEVETGGLRDPWDERPWLVHSDGSDEGGDHFVVETDELGRSLLRFGNGVNGRALPAGAAVHCAYQVGEGLDGNVGADTLRWFDVGAFPRVRSCRNPLDVTDGRAPEPPEEIVRRVPEAFRQRQLRAITLRDYVHRAEEVPGVFRAAAAYRWTGSWRTVRVTVDPAATTTLDERLAGEVLRHLEAVRLIGEDLEVRPPRFVPLEIVVELCLRTDYWPRDVRFLLEQEFSTGYAPAGDPAFFHPDRWTFGQALRTSEIIARVQRVEGVHHVVAVEMRRLYQSVPVPGEVLEVGPSEIIRVDNDPDHRERGTIRFDIRGGRG